MGRRMLRTFSSRVSGLWAAAAATAAGDEDGRGRGAEGAGRDEFAGLPVALPDGMAEAAGDEAAAAQGFHVADLVEDEEKEGVREVVEVVG